MVSVLHRHRRRLPTNTAQSHMHFPRILPRKSVLRGFGSGGVVASWLGGVADGGGAIYGPQQGGGFSLEAQARGTLVGLT